MAFSIKNPETDRIARQLAAITGESLTQAVDRALRERFSRHQAPARRGAGTELARLARKLAKSPVLDPRTPDEILGYDETGLPR